jgi:hypothetical protein
MIEGRSKKIICKYGLNDVFKLYKKRSKNKIDRKVFSSFVREMNEEILRLIIYDGYDFTMPNRLGSIRIRRFENSLRLDENGEIKNKLFPDFNKSISYWKKIYANKTAEEIKEIKNKPIIYHLNSHTEGTVLKWHWDKVSSNIKNQSVYGFSIVRCMKREAAKAWKACPNLKYKYYE